MTTNYTTSELFTSFVSLYMKLNSVDISTALGNTAKGIAANVVSKTIDFANPSATFDKTGNYSSAWPAYNSNVSFAAACSAMADAQQRLMNILANPNYSLTVAAGGLPNAIDQYALIFNLLYYADVSSSFDVTSYVPSQFVADFSSYFVNSAGTVDAAQSALLADEYCNSAANVRSQVVLTYMSINDAAHSQYRGVTWNNYTSAADSNFDHLPTYQLLFGNQEYIAVPEFSSVLSPAAYLVDLNKCEQTYVVRSSDATPSISFAYRRPDVLALTLDETNTDSDVSKLGIGIDLLSLQLYAQLHPGVAVTSAAVAAPTYATDVQNSLSSLQYPFSAPFNYNLQKVRATLALSNTSLPAIWTAMYPASIYDVDTSYQIAISRETLGISGEEYALLSTPLATSKDQAAQNLRYGVAGESENIIDLDTFEAKTGLSGAQVEDLLYGDLSDAEISAGLNAAFYINHDQSTAGPMAINAETDQLSNTSVLRLDRINRFIRLSNAVGYQFADLDWTLAYISACEQAANNVDVLDSDQAQSAFNYLAPIKSLTDMYGALGVNGCLALVGLLKNFGEENGASQIRSVFGAAAPDYADANATTWIPDDASDAANLATTYAIMSGVGLSQGDLLTLSAYVAQQFGLAADDRITLTQDFLSALYRVAMSARVCGLDIGDMLFLLDQLDPDYCRFAGPLRGAGAAVGMLMLDAFFGVQDYASSLSSANLSMDSVMFVSNDQAYQNPQLSPGLNATLTLLTDIANSTAGNLLTENVFSNWLAGQDGDAPNYPADVMTIYSQFVAENVIDDQGVVLNTTVSQSLATACFKGTDDLVVAVDSALLTSLNALLAQYGQLQDAVVNGVLSQALALAPDVAQTVSTWGALLCPATVKAGMSNALHIFYTLTADTVAASGGTIAALTAANVSAQMNYYAAATRFATVLNRLNLSRQEVQFLVQGKATLVQRPLTSFGLSLAAVGQVVDLHNLIVSYADADNNLLSFLWNEKLPNLLAATGWDQASVQALLGGWSIPISTSGVVTMEDAIGVVAALKNSMALNGQTGLSILALFGICGYAAQSGNAAFAALADQVEQALYAANPDADESTILTTLQISLNEAYRDVLVDTLVFYFSESPDTTLNAVRNASALSEYLLFDVETQGKFVTSTIEDAINAYQMLFYRMLMQLEPQLSFTSAVFPEDYWPWFRNYRVWEANRKVFLNPENYLEPDLRSNASEIFTDFINNLQAGTLSDTLTTTAFNTYLDSFSTVAKLKIAASNFTPLDANNCTVTLVGQTNTSPSVYYYRNGNLNLNTSTGAYSPTGWDAWSQISTAIPSDYIQAIYAFNRLFIFWVEFSASSASSGAGGAQAYQAAIKYCFYTLTGGWSAAQTVATVQVGNDLSSYDDYLESADYNDLLLTYSDVITVVYSFPGMSTTHAYTVSETLAASKVQLDSMVISGDSSEVITNNVTVWSGELSNIYVPDTGPVPGDGAYGVTSGNGITVQTGGTYGLAQLDAGTGIAVSFWIQVKAWANFSGGEIALVEFNQQIGNNGQDVLLCLGANTIYLYRGDPSEYDLAEAAASQLAGQTAIPTTLDTDQWLYVGVSLKQSGATLNGNFYIGLESDGNIQDVLSTSFESTSLGSITLGDLPVMFMGGGSNAGVQYQDITIASDFLAPTQMRDFSGLPAPSAPIVQPFAALPSWTTAGYVPNSSEKLYIMDTGEAEYLALPQAADLSTWRYIRLTSSQTAANFDSIFLTGGVSQLLDTSTQMSSESSFSALQPQIAKVPREYWPIDDHIDMGGANNIYYWELFLFAPWLIAKSYHDAGTYDSAQDWYQYIFNPGKQLNAVSTVELAQLNQDDNASDLYWRFVGLRSYDNALLTRELNAASQEEVVEDAMDQPLAYQAGASGSTFVVSSATSQALGDYYDDPFDPHAIAMLRPVAYQKAIVMHYVQNLLDWGDLLYTQETRETIVEAALLYMQADDLLGDQPADAGTFSEASASTLATIDSAYGSGSGIPEFLVGLEGSLTAIATPVTPTADQMLPYNYVPGLTFGIPENEQLLNFWSLASSRLSNIRNYLDINGNPMNLALFEPAINVMNLVSAAAGSSLSSALAATQANRVPNYRFTALLDTAQEYAQIVSGFGQTMLSILEKKDAEALAQLQISQQATILSMSLEMKQYQINAAQSMLGQLKESMVSALTRYAYYSGVLSWNAPTSRTKSSNLGASDMGASAFSSSSDSTQTDGVTNVSASISMTDATLATTSELVGSTLSMASGVLMGIGAMQKILAVGGFLAPNIFGTADGGSSLGAASSAAGDNFINTAWAISTLSGAVNESASYLRRNSDWQLQKQLAQSDVTQIGEQYNAAQIQLQSAQQDYAVMRQQIAQNQVIADFYTGKFTSEALYQWMSGQLSSTYSQAYQLARSMAQTAQFALEYEKGLPINSLNIVNTNSWSSNYKGMLAGELLLQSLNQLERYYIDNNMRTFEIVKTVSLANLLADNPGYQPLTAQLAANGGGTVRFSLPESLFDQDYPGHYCRQIKAVSLSVPAVLGPYQDLHATLMQTGSKVVLSADNAAIDYLYGNTDSAPSSIRANYGVNQQIAVSSGLGDSGLFALDFNDARYLPFEGTGAVSDWSLYISDLDTTLNPTAGMSISDIIVTLRYTALSGGQGFGSYVRKALQTAVKAAPAAA
jgi:hypothetical protein